MAFNLQQMLEAFFRGVVTYGGTGMGGNITGNVTGGSGSGSSYPSGSGSPSARDTGSTQDTGGYFDEDGNYIDMDLSYNEETGLSFQILHLPEMVLNSGPYIDMYLEYNPLAGMTDQIIGFRFDHEVVVGDPNRCDGEVVLSVGSVPYTLSVGSWHPQGRVFWEWTVNTVEFPDGSVYSQPGPVLYGRSIECDLQDLLNDPPWGRWIPGRVSDRIRAVSLWQPPGMVRTTS
jgi:hypothetical protein